MTEMKGSHFFRKISESIVPINKLKIFKAEEITFLDRIQARIKAGHNMEPQTGLYGVRHGMTSRENLQGN